jgi:hypothetical protein
MFEAIQRIFIDVIRVMTLQARQTPEERQRCERR